VRRGRPFDPGRGKLAVVPRPATDHCDQRTFWLRCRDGEPICATAFAPAGRAVSAPLLVVNGAMGNTQARYWDMAQYWAAKGWRVVTYDYRGMGESERRQTETGRFRLRDWGQQDLAAVLDWARRDFAPSILVILGHSIGAQIVQFCEELGDVDAAVFVAGQKGWWRNWNNHWRYAIWALWHLVMPVCVRLCDSFPLMRLAGCETLPACVARDWACWGRSRDFVDERGARMETKGAGLRCPLLSISLEDDPVYGPKPAVDALLGWYPNARGERLHIVPAEHGARAVGHAGLFDECHFDRFWPVIWAWLDQRLADNSRRGVEGCRGGEPRRALP
jgi:predicted alpha/beta hydrolase